MLPVCFQLIAVVCAVAHAGNPLTLSVSSKGDYSLSTPEWQLVGAPVRIFANGVWLSSADGSLAVQGQPATSSGFDAWGAYRTTSLIWVTVSGEPILDTTFATYEDVPAVQFIAKLLIPITTHALPDARDDLSTEFPSWLLPDTAGSLGFFQWSGTMLNRKNDLGPIAGPWVKNSSFSTGLASGPVVLYDASGASSLVLSPSSQFMAVSAASAADGTALGWGLLGSTSNIPTAFSYACVAWYGAGINSNVMAWGAALLARHGKAHGLSREDFTNTHLGYNTDHGAYYYYNVGPYGNYSVALEAVYDYAVAVGIPYRHVLLDSWWYYKEEPKRGVINWTAQDTAPYFTGGNAGIRALVEKTNWKIIAHNRYWSSQTNYAKQNGGPWEFFIDAPGTPDPMAVPLEQSFWDWLLSSSVAEWGLTTYEQDWLHNEMEGVTALYTNVTLGRTWLLQMGAGAETAGVSVQLCMPYPRHALQSVEMPTATQIRVSDDHMPGPLGGNTGTQWSLGFSSMLAWAVGLAPFKDNYWSTAQQPGSSQPPGSIEVTPALHAAISTLSAGAVTPGDGVNASDAELILRSCTAAGRLLQPSRAITAIDAMAVALAFPASPAALPGGGVVYATYTQLPSGLFWDHVLAANLTTPYAVGPATLGPTRADAVLRGPTGLRVAGSTAHVRAAAPAPAVAYSLNTTTLDPASLQVLFPWDDTYSIRLTPCRLADFALWHSAPVLGNWALLGELGKWVPVSEARFASVSTNGDQISAVVVGQAGEQVALTFWHTVTRQPQVVRCTLPASGQATISAPNGVCIE